jgi:hypothetical protein
MFSFDEIVKLTIKQLVIPSDSEGSSTVD